VAVLVPNRVVVAGDPTMPRWRWTTAAAVGLGGTTVSAWGPQLPAIKASLGIDAATIGLLASTPVLHWLENRRSIAGARLLIAAAMTVVGLALILGSVCVQRGGPGCQRLLAGTRVVSNGKELVVSATVADVMVATLKASGVRRVYGILGDSLNGFTDALRRDGAITWEHVRHEEAAGFAAAAEAALTGELAVCAASCGPGNLHLINGLFDANRSGAPVLAIAAHIPREEIGGSYFQETHPQELFRECGVYCELVSVPDQLPRILEIAMRAALQRGGVAVVVVPGEVFLADTPDAAPPSPIRAVSPLIVPDEQSLAAAARVLNEASRVTILAGVGCAGAHDQLLRFAGAVQAPVLHAFRGKEFVEYDNPYDVGMTGLLGFSSGYRAMEHCDTLVMLGTDFPYRPFYPEGVPVIQVDVRGERIGRRVPSASLW
jgi:pyruvate dehydrogenase (quinone)